MASKAETAAAEARRKAQEAFAKDKARDTAIVMERQREREANAAKTIKLRNMRLAKEAADRETAAAAAAELPKKKAPARKISPPKAS